VSTIPRSGPAIAGASTPTREIATNSLTTRRRIRCPRLTRSFSRPVG
jgi:hypothetical protein